MSSKTNISLALSIIDLARKHHRSANCTASARSHLVQRSPDPANREDVRRGHVRESAVGALVCSQRADELDGGEPLERLVISRMASEAL
eukprot:6214128-Pleurochrysis_carterae.AAC.2